MKTEPISVTVTTTVMECNAAGALAPVVVRFEADTPLQAVASALWRCVRRGLLPMAEVRMQCRALCPADWHALLDAQVVLETLAVANTLAQLRRGQEPQELRIRLGTPGQVSYFNRVLPAHQRAMALAGATPLQLGAVRRRLQLGAVQRPVAA